MSDVDEAALGVALSAEPQDAEKVTVLFEGVVSKPLPVSVMDVPASRPTAGLTFEM